MKMYIRGQACDASGGKTIDVVNPATGEIVDTIPAATAKDVDDAIAYAVEGQKRWVKWKCSEMNIIHTNLSNQGICFCSGAGLS